MFYIVLHVICIISTFLQYVMFMLHVCELTFRSAGGGDRGYKTARRDGCQARVTDCVSTFASMKLLDIFNKTLGHFPSVCGNRTRLAKT